MPRWVWGAPSTFGQCAQRTLGLLPDVGAASKDTKFERSHGDASDGSTWRSRSSFRAGSGPRTQVDVAQSRGAGFDGHRERLVYAILDRRETRAASYRSRLPRDLSEAGAPPLPKTGTMTAEERGQNTTHTILYAFDAETGQELYSSKDAIDDWTISAALPLPTAASM